MGNVNNVATGKYGIVITNHVAGVKTGEVNIQYALNATDFASIPAQNGMLLVENHAAKTLDLPSAVTQRVGLVASVEKMYDESDMSLGNFRSNLGEFLPRIYTLKVNDKFTTNNFKYESATYADYAALAAVVAAGTAVYGYTTTTGQISVVAAQDATAVNELMAVTAVTLPNGEKALKFVVTKA
jgi:hypothetical protein